MELAERKFEAALKQARLAEAAHLDALVALKDGKALRLDALRERLLQGLPLDDGLRPLIELKLLPGETPRLFLDLISSVGMGADGRLYELQQDREGDRIVTYETPDVDAMYRHILKMQAHKRIAEARSATGVAEIPAPGASSESDWISIVYIWMTGFIFGASALAAWAIYTGKLVL